MVVDDILQKAATLLQTDSISSKAASATEQVQRTGKPATDKVDISGLIQRMTTTMADYDTQRAQKVAALKELVSSGGYSVSGEAVAEKMIASARGKY